MKPGGTLSNRSEYDPDTSEIREVWRSIEQLKFGQVRDTERTLRVISSQMKYLSEFADRSLLLAHNDNKAVRLPYTELSRISVCIGELTIALSKVYFFKPFN